MKFSCAQAPSFRRRCSCVPASGRGIAESHRHPGRSRPPRRRRQSAESSGGVRRDASAARGAAGSGASHDALHFAALLLAEESAPGPTSISWSKARHRGTRWDCTSRISLRRCSNPAPGAASGSRRRTRTRPRRSSSTSCPTSATCAACRRPSRGPSRSPPTVMARSIAVRPFLCASATACGT